MAVELVSLPPVSDILTAVDVPFVSVLAGVSAVTAFPTVSTCPLPLVFPTFLSFLLLLTFLILLVSLVLSTSLLLLAGIPASANVSFALPLVIQYCSGALAPAVVLKNL